MDHSTRTDTVLFILPSERPLPPALSPRTAPHPSRAQRMVVGFLLCVAAFVAAGLAMPLIAVFAYVAPQSVIVTMVVLLVAYEIVRQAMRTTAGAR